MTGANPPESLGPTREITVVVRREGRFDILPASPAGLLPFRATNIVTAKASARLDLSDSMLALAELVYTIDDNQTQLAQNEQGIVTRVFRDPKKLGFSLLLQARF